MSDSFHSANAETKSVQAHTPGPWQELPPRIGASVTIYAADGQTPIATTCSNTSPKTMEMHRSGEVKANARLIAAAPELLEALKAITPLTEECAEELQASTFSPLVDAIKAARAAIAKATGAA